MEDVVVVVVLVYGDDDDDGIASGWLCVFMLVAVLTINTQTNL